MKYIAPTKEEFFNQVKSYINEEDSLRLIEKAYNYAYEKHSKQLRKSGEPYFVHVISVAYELAKMHCGPKTIAAGFLHDVMEDCGVTKEEFVKEFGEDIYQLDEAVTKIGNLKFSDEKEYQAANHRKIFIAMAKDIRVILIKLVDRLHNMRTLEYQPKDKQLKIARETLDVYAPIAHRLGIAEIKNELEDLSFYYLNPEKYHEVAKLLESKKPERDAQVKKMIEDISRMLDQHNIPYRIFGRSKHLYSIYNKMVKKNKRFEEIYDLLAIRIVTKTELNCYEILGYIHNAYPPMPGRLKDYIAVPKTNMYRSLHTTVVGNDGKIFEIQIRTEEMDQIAEKGVAAHWAYKEGNYDSHQEQKEIVKELNWLKEFEDSENNANEYMETVIGDVFNANVYVMTPKGRVIDLPQGSCPIDFAYRIHTDVGNRTVGAVINGAMVPLNTPLKTGDVCEIRTSNNASPSEDWIKICKSKQARNKIRNYFEKKELEEKEETIKEGEQILRDTCLKEGVNEDDIFNKEKLEKIYSDLAVKNYNDLMYSIGKKSMSPQAIIERLVKFGKKELDSEVLDSILKKNQKRSASVSKSGVIVQGVSDIKIELASCCTPIYGDKIVGFVAQGQGIKVHRDCCPNILNKKRLINVEWDKHKPDIKYSATMRILAKDRNFLLTDLVTCISQYKANLTSVNITANPEDLMATASISISVDGIEHLEMIMSNLRKINSVIEVERAIK